MQRIPKNIILFYIIMLSFLINNLIFAWSLSAVQFYRDTTGYMAGMLMGVNYYISIAFASVLIRYIIKTYFQKKLASFILSAIIIIIPVRLLITTFDILNSSSFGVIHAPIIIEKDLEKNRISISSKDTNEQYTLFCTRAEISLLQENTAYNLITYEFYTADYTQGYLREIVP